MKEVKEESIQVNSCNEMQDISQNANNNQSSMGPSVTLSPVSTNRVPVLFTSTRTDMELDTATRIFTDTSPNSITIRNDSVTVVPFQLVSLYY